MKLALFRNPNSDKPYVGDELTDKYCVDLVRISEWVDVEFPAMPADARQAQLARIEMARSEVRRQYETAIARINTQAEALAS